jgi:hypothetical protein
MIREGAWYGDALPSGEWVAQVPEHPLHTHAGSVPLPPGESWGLQFLTIGESGKFAGLAHDLGHTWEWDGTWHDRGYVSGRCAYVRGELKDMPHGVGFVNDDGELVSYITSYQPKNGISSWSETAGLQIGQGHDVGGVLVYDGSQLRVLDTGPCNEIKAHRDGELVAITYRKDSVGIISNVWTLAQLRALPVLETPPPPPPPPPPPETKMLLPADVLCRCR